MFRRRRQIILDSAPEDVSPSLVWACDYEDAWPGRNIKALDSWAPHGEDSTIDMNLDNSNYNFHINSSGIILPQWGNTGEFKMRPTDQLSDDRYAVLLQAADWGSYIPPPHEQYDMRWIVAGEDLYIAFWAYWPSDSVGASNPLFWEWHHRGELDYLLLPDGIAPHAVVTRDASSAGWQPRPGDGFVPTSGNWLNYRATLGEGSPPGNPGVGWWAKHWAICPATKDTFLKLIIRNKQSNNNDGRIQVWFDNISGTGPGSFNQFAPAIDYTGPTEMWATTYGYPEGLGFFGTTGLYTGRNMPSGLVHVYSGGFGRAHTTFAGAASEFI